ncbi:SDR family oxidoreductase [Uliginosibacterium sp. sgz301328]|uniref:SDR family oxidoreductase n=1 Tax=Uliginosibacterium sp. sgz301328 TaxID=3243764 RepID=UPI00359E7E5C
MSNPFDLSGKVALITGAAQGIGAAIAIKMAEAGASVIAADFAPMTDETKTGLEAAVAKTGGKFWYLKANLTEAGAPQRVIDEAVKLAGQVDILGNVAGTIRRAPFLEHTEEDFDFVMKINLYAPVYLSQAFCRHVVGRNGKGKIINICSMLSYQGGILVPGYTASKHGIAGITKLIANEMASKGINCNGIAPGYIATANTAPIRADEARNKAILDRIPAGRWGQPEDLAGTAVFLAAEASDYLNGTIVNVDGGWQAR